MDEIRAFILAAGLGTRLRPLTDEIPKPLLPVFQKPLITFAIDSLLASGIKKISFNTRYLFEKFYQEFQVKENPSLQSTGFYQNYPLEVFRETEHLDSGGGIRNAGSFLEQSTFLIHNGDIFSDISFKKLVAHHRASGALATLVLRQSGGTANVHYDEKNNRVLDLRGHLQKGQNTPTFVYAGIAVAEAELISWIEPKGPVSIVDSLLNAMKAGQHIAGFVSHSGFWSDLGTPENYLGAHLNIKKWNPDYPLKNHELPWPTPIHPLASIDPSLKLEGTVVIGAGASIGKNVHLDNSIILAGAHIKDDTTLSNVIVRGSSFISGCHCNTIL